MFFVFAYSSFIIETCKLTVKLTSDFEPNAEIAADNIYIDNALFGEEIKVDFGLHSLTVEKRGFYSACKLLDAKEKQQILDIQLVSKKRTVCFDIDECVDVESLSVTANSTVLNDGFELKPGIYNILIQDDFNCIVKTVVIKPSEEPFIISIDFG